MIRVLTKNYKFKWGCLIRKYGKDARIKDLLERIIGSGKGGKP